MKKIVLIFVLFFVQLNFGQQNYRGPVEPLYENGDIKNFYDYLAKSIDLSKFQNEDKVIVAFVLDSIGKMNHIKVAFCENKEAEKELLDALNSAKNWDMSNQKDKRLFVCYKLKFIFSNEKVLGMKKVSWYTRDIEDIQISQGEFFSNVEDINDKKDKNDNNDKNKVHYLADIEKQPEYPDGIDGFREMIGKNFRPPSDKNFKGGKIFVQFVIERDGSLTDIKVIRDAGFGTADEAIRVVKKSKKWKPAEQRGELVRCSYMLPITIQPSK